MVLVACRSVPAFGFQFADGEEVMLDGLPQGIVIARPFGQASRAAFFP
jgi:hypothetical protein